MIWQGMGLHVRGENDVDIWPDLSTMPQSQSQRQPVRQLSQGSNPTGKDSARDERARFIPPPKRKTAKKPYDHEENGPNGA